MKISNNNTTAKTHVPTKAGGFYHLWMLQSWTLERERERVLPLNAQKIILIEMAAEKYE
jgi:hypothetical protein